MIVYTNISRIPHTRVVICLIMLSVMIKLISSVSLSDFVSDHCPLHATITCTRHHPERKKITYRCLKNINSDRLSNDISNIDFKIDSDDVDLIVDNYNSAFSSLLDTHAPLKSEHVISRDLQPWKREKRKSEQIWRKTKLTVHLEIYRALCLKLKTLIHDSKEKCFQKKISDCGGDQNELFRIVNSLLGRGKQAIYPKHTDSSSLASVFNNYFVTKITDIRKEFPDLEVHAAQLSITDFDISFDLSSSRLCSFTLTTVSEVQELLSIINQTTCSLDPFNTKIIMQHSEQFINVFVHIINLCFSSGIFPASFKAAVVKQPLLKKPCLGSETLNNFFPVSNLTFLSKLIEKVIARRLFAHLQDNGIKEKF